MGNLWSEFQKTREEWDKVFLSKPYSTHALAIAGALTSCCKKTKCFMRPFKVLIPCPTCNAYKTALHDGHHLHGSGNNEVAICR